MSRVESLIFSSPQAFSHEDLAVSGTLPAYVEGTYYLNGPGLFQRAGTTYNHWLDGDALLRQLKFHAGKVSYKSQYLGSRRHVQEQQAGHPIYRNFGTAFEGDRLNPSGMGLEANINVSAYTFKDRLLAFGEQALPMLVDPGNLETLAEVNFDGALKDSSPFSGHPKHDPRTGHLCNFGVQFLGKRGLLHYYEMDADLKLVTKGSTSLPYAASMHDFAISENYACFFLAPYVLDVRQVSQKGDCLLDALHWKTDETCQLVIMRRNDGTLAARVPLARTTYALHLVNAFERDGQLVVDLIDTARPFFDQYLHQQGLFADIAPCTTLRLGVDLQSWKQVSLEEVHHGQHLDFPSINRAQLSAEYQHYWILGMPTEAGPKFYNQLLRFDWSTASMVDSYQCADGWVLSGEPAFVPDPNSEGGGSIIQQLHQLETGMSEYILFDAFELKRGPYVRIPLNQFDPMGFHSVFEPTAGFSAWKQS